MLRLRLGIGLTATFVPTRKGRLRGALQMDAGKNGCARCANLAHLRVAGRFGLPLRWIALSRGATRLQPLDGLRRRRRDQPLCLDQAPVPDAGVLQSRVVRLRRTVREQRSAHSSLIVCVRQLPRCRRAQRLARRVLAISQIARPIRHWTAQTAAQPQVETGRARTQTARGSGRALMRHQRLRRCYPPCERLSGWVQVGTTGRC